MNKTVVFVTFSCLAAIGLGGGAYIIAERPDASATFVNLLVQVLGLVVSAAGIFYMLGKTNEKIEEVRQQGNGTLSRKDERIDELTAELIRANRLLRPDNFDTTTGATITPDEGAIE